MNMLYRRQRLGKTYFPGFFVFGKNLKNIANTFKLKILFLNGIFGVKFPSNLV